MSLAKKLLLSTVIGLTGLATAQADLKVSRENGNLLERPAASQSATSNIYIVQMQASPVIAYDGDIKGYQATKPGKGKKLNPNSAAVKKYASFLEKKQNQVVRSVGAEKVYNYRYALNGFAARMTAADAEKLKKNPDVVHVWKDEIRKLQTDTSPTYIGLTEGGQAWSKGLTGEDVVIGIVDTGIWPEHPSFADVKTPKKGNKGPDIAYGPIDDFTPSGCDFGNTAANPADAPFSCNNKLLAARCYNSGFSSGPDASNPCGGDGADTAPWEFQSGRDADGHGDHTASTAGGNNGVPAYINGVFQGNISGVAPRARLATYKVCWDGPNPNVTTDDGCASSDSAAAIDQAVADGVDVINFSIGGSSNSFASPDDLAFLFAADAGVWVAASAGNSGPDAGTVGTPSGVPWLTATGATNDDGVFYANVQVNSPGSIAGSYDGVEGAGEVSFQDTGPITADVQNASDILACDPIDPMPGKIALVSRGVCSFTIKYNNAAAAGAVAIIVYTDDRPVTTMSAPGTSIPGVMVSTDDGLTMAGETGVNVTVGLVPASNRIASFSSRGPNNGMPDVIKPDLSAPGVKILAAVSPWGAGGEEFANYNGTSMASPHVAGSFALLKQAHPDWTPAIARSALMTTARNGLKKSFGDDPADPFDVGAGEILPSNAVDPGLAYDVGFLDYLAALCGEPAQADIVDSESCDFLDSEGFSFDPSDLNLASIGIGSLVETQTITRTVTAVYNNNGSKNFTVSVDAPPGIDVSVSPSSFKLRKGDSMTYEVTFNITGDTVMGEWAFGSLTWADDDGNYSVRSPIAVRPVAATNEGVFTKTVDASNATSGDTLSYELVVTNENLNGPVTVTDVLPAGTSFVSGSETEVVDNGLTSSPWSYDAASNSLSWTGELFAGEMDVSQDPGGSVPGGYLPLASLGVPPLSSGCNGDCDDGGYWYNVPAFTYNGVTYTDTLFSVNGTIEAGSASGVFSSYNNQDLPNPLTPNNILAPFWRDLNQSAGGEMYLAVLNLGCGTATAYEWEAVPLYGSTDTVTMQVWIGNDGGCAEGLIHYVYGQMDNTADGGTVGAENAGGTIGDTYFYNGVGTAPVEGDELLVQTLPGGTATLGFQVTTDCSEDLIVNEGDLSNGEVSEQAIAVTSCQ